MSECAREVFEIAAILAQLSVTAKSTRLVQWQLRGGNILFNINLMKKKETDGKGVLHFKCLRTHVVFEAYSRCRGHGQIQIFSLQREVNHEHSLTQYSTQISFSTVGDQFISKAISSKYYSQAMHLWCINISSSLGEVMYLIFYNRI